MRALGLRLPNAKQTATQIPVMRPSGKRTPIAKWMTEGTPMADRTMEQIPVMRTSGMELPIVK
jgi:hypothetical protein